MPDMAIADEFEELLNMDYVTDVLLILTGFMLPTVLQNLAGGVVPDRVDTDEIYCLVSGIALYALVPTDDAYGADFQLATGSALAGADALTERFGVKEKIVDAGA